MRISIGSKIGLLLLMMSIPLGWTYAGSGSGANKCKNLFGVKQIAPYGGRGAPQNSIKESLQYVADLSESKPSLKFPAKGRKSWISYFEEIDYQAYAGKNVLTEFSENNRRYRYSQIVFDRETLPNTLQQITKEPLRQIIEVSEQNSGQEVATVIYVTDQAVLFGPIVKSDQMSQIDYADLDRAFLALNKSLKAAKGAGQLKQAIILHTHPTRGSFLSDTDVIGARDLAYDIQYRNPSLEGVHIVAAPTPDRGALLFWNFTKVEQASDSFY